MIIGVLLLFSMHVGVRDSKRCGLFWKPFRFIWVHLMRLDGCLMNKQGCGNFSFILMR